MLFIGGVAFATPVMNSAVSSAQTSSNSNSVAIGNMAAPTANAGALSRSNATGGAARVGNVSSKSGNATGGAAKVGNVTSKSGNAKSSAIGTVKVGGASVTQNFAASKIPAQLPIVSAPGVPVPQIFSRLNAPTNMKSVPLVEWEETTCDTTATREYPLKDMVFKNHYLLGGKLELSGNTTVVFSPTHIYFWLKKIPPYKGEMPMFIHPVKVKSVSIITAQEARAHKYLCLGLLTVVSKKDGLGLAGVISDARVAPLGYMEGWRNIKLVLIPSAVAAATGVRTAGKSFSIIPTFVKMASSALSGGGAGASISGGEGATYASARIGATFLVFAPSPNGKFYRIGK